MIGVAVLRLRNVPNWSGKNISLRPNETGNMGRSLINRMEFFSEISQGSVNFATLATTL